MTRASVFMLEQDIESIVFAGESVSAGKIQVQAGLQAVVPRRRQDDQIVESLPDRGAGAFAGIIEQDDHVRRRDIAANALDRVANVIVGAVWADRDCYHQRYLLQNGPTLFPCLTSGVMVFFNISVRRSVQKPIP